MKKYLRVFTAGVVFAVAAIAAPAYQNIVIAESSHPAIHSAAVLLAQDLGLTEAAVKSEGKLAAPRAGEIVLTAEPALAGTHAAAVKGDGYVVVFEGGGALVYGKRPRSLLYAAGDWRQWTGRASGTFLRNPAFAMRTAAYDGSRSVAEYVATLGVNAIILKQNDAVVTLKDTMPEVYRQLSPADQTRLDQERVQRKAKNLEFAKECHDADITLYSFLYGNDVTGWSRPIYQALLKAYPSVKGTPEPRSFEKGFLCPSDPMTWKFVRAYVTDFMDQTGADGMYATFWDRYGIYCHDDRCRRDGMDHFNNEVYANVKAYYDALHAMNKKLVMRTWSSGTPHWLGKEYVHAPGSGNFGGSKMDVWGRVIHELPADIIIQTKAYYSDCEPDPRVNPFIGQAKPHPQIIEYQQSGQTLGRFYFPASQVDFNTATMRKAYQLMGPQGGVNIFPGGTAQTNYSVLDDIANSFNLYFWRELSWNPNLNVDQAWIDWATPVYGAKAAPYIVQALKLSEEAVARTFSTLGMGSSTNSDFAGDIARRETLLMYTNRYYLPDFAKYLEPTKENIQRVIDEKVEAQRKIEEMSHQVDLAKPYLTQAQYDELKTRIDWLKEFSICSRYSDEALWRYRYLRGLAAMMTTDPAQMKLIDADSQALQEHAKLLFQFDPALKFSCYNTTLGKLQRRPSLGSPLRMMREIVTKSRQLVENSAGPDYLPPTGN
ncbi:MAG TPA: hypothetical protein VG675_09130 [Bryobacteraceae bacterium]|nr:hypothetical protein [Bryobacteraceae bacterium]